jgi:hypothetical protein
MLRPGGRKRLEKVQHSKDLTSDELMPGRLPPLKNVAMLVALAPDALVEPGGAAARTRWPRSRKHARMASFDEAAVTILPAPLTFEALGIAVAPGILRLRQREIRLDGQSVQCVRARLRSERLRHEQNRKKSKCAKITQRVE